MAKAKKAVVLDGNKLMEVMAKKKAHEEQLRVTHAALTNETCTYSYSVRLENGETDIITNECGRQFHNDLRQAFRLFDGHLAVITEQVDAEEVSDIDSCEGRNKKVSEKLIQTEVSDISIYGNLETGSVILKGTKLLKTTEQIKLPTPKTALDGDYAFVNELAGAVQNLIEEITAYHNGKSRPDAQLDIFKEAAKEDENQ